MAMIETVLLKNTIAPSEKRAPKLIDNTVSNSGLGLRKNNININNINTPEMETASRLSFFMRSALVIDIRAAPKGTIRTLLLNSFFV